MGESEFKRVITLTFAEERVVVVDDGYMVDIIELHGVSPQLVAARFLRDIKPTVEGLVVFLKVWESIGHE